MEQANVTTINGKPYEQPKGPPYETHEQLRADLESTGERVVELTQERDELARRLAAIKSQLGTGGAAEARRSLARVLTSVMSEKNLDPVFVCEELAGSRWTTSRSPRPPRTTSAVPPRVEL